MPHSQGTAGQLESCIWQEHPKEPGKDMNLTSLKHSRPVGGRCTNSNRVGTACHGKAPLDSVPSTQAPHPESPNRASLGLCGEKSRTWCLSAWCPCDTSWPPPRPVHADTESLQHLPATGARPRRAHAESTSVTRGRRGQCGRLHKFPLSHQPCGLSPLMK